MIAGADNEAVSNIAELNMSPTVPKTELIPVMTEADRGIRGRGSAEGGPREAGTADGLNK